jgi:hypothetical protein
MPKVGEVVRKRKKTGPKPIDPALRFWPKVDKNGPIHPVHGQCWIWTATKISSGYGEFHLKRDGNKDILARIYSYEMAYGIPEPGLYILHKCDTTLCVNPAHLFAGTQKENIADMHRKGRQPPVECRTMKGEDHPGATTNDEEVKIMRKLSDAGKSFKQVCQAFPHLSDMVVYGVITRKSWRHLP